AREGDRHALEAGSLCRNRDGLPRTFRGNGHRACQAAARDVHLDIAPGGLPGDFAGSVEGAFLPTPRESAVLVLQAGADLNLVADTGAAARTSQLRASTLAILVRPAGDLL